MAKLDILLYPHPTLTTPTQPVEEITEEIQTLIDNMIDTMYEAPGIGLAAPQVGESVRICVLDVANTEEEEVSNLFVMINPRVVESSGKITWDEGCLSMPELYREVTRPGKVTVEALNRDGEVYRVEAEGLLAVCMQHEIDHLDGVMFIDHLGRLKKKMALKEWTKIKRRLETEKKDGKKKGDKKKGDAQKGARA